MPTTISSGFFARSHWHFPILRIPALESILRRVLGPLSGLIQNFCLGNARSQFGNSFRRCFDHILRECDENKSIASKIATETVTSRLLNMRILSFSCWYALVIALAIALAWQVDADDDAYVYLLGTSFYFVNGGLGDQFENLYKQAIGNQDADVHTDMMAISALPLEFHINGLNSDLGAMQYFYPDLEGNSKSYSWIVVQENSRVNTLGDDWVERSIQAAVDANNMAVEGGIQTMYVMSWGYRTGLRPRKQPEIGTISYLEHHQLMEDLYYSYVERSSTPENPTYLAPAGLVYKTIYTDCQNAGMEPTDDECLFARLYKVDDFHNSMQGTYLMALTIVATMTGADPMSLTWQTPNGIGKYPYSIPEEEANWIRSAVSRTILETYDSGKIQYPFPERPVWVEQKSSEFAIPSLQPIRFKWWQMIKGWINPLWWLGCVDYGNGCLDPSDEP